MLKSSIYDVEISYNNPFHIVSYYQVKLPKNLKIQTDKSIAFSRGIVTSVSYDDITYRFDRLYDLLDKSSFPDLDLFNPETWEIFGIQKEKDWRLIHHSLEPPTGRKLQYFKKLKFFPKNQYEKLHWESYMSRIDLGLLFCISIGVVMCTIKI